MRPAGTSASHPDRARSWGRSGTGRRATGNPPRGKAVPVSAGGEDVQAAEFAFRLTSQKSILAVFHNLSRSAVFQELTQFSPIRFHVLRIRLEFRQAPIEFRGFHDSGVAGQNGKQRFSLAGGY